MFHEFLYIFMQNVKYMGATVIEFCFFNWITKNEGHKGIVERAQETRSDIGMDNIAIRHI